MSLSDWLQIVLSLVGFIVGAWVSWMFFRAQQKTDFVALRDAIQSLKNQDLKNIDKNIAIIQKANDVATYIRLNKEIGELHNSIYRLNGDVNGLPQKILSDFRTEQHIFLGRVNEKFNEKVLESQSTLEQHIRKELANFLPTANQQDKLVERLSELTKFVVISMGIFQRETIAIESEDVLTRTERKINNAVSPVSEVLDGVDKQVKQLSQLPKPTNSQQ